MDNIYPSDSLVPGSGELKGELVKPAPTTVRSTEHPRPDYFLLHISDTHLLSGGGRLYDQVSSEDHLRQLFEEFEASGGKPDAIIFTGDLADLGEPDAYKRIRGIVEPAAERLGTEVVWVMGNHDKREAFRVGLLDEPASTKPVDAITWVGGLRIITLDSTVPGHHYGEVTVPQLEWLMDVLSTPAPDGTILAMHHPPVPSVLDLATTVELRDQAVLADVLAGTDVRSIIAGHLHYSSTATFAGIPVSVASSTCYTQDLNVPVGGTRGRDGARAFNLVHVYPSTVLHSVVPLGAFSALDWIDAEESANRIRQAGLQIPERATQRTFQSSTQPVTDLGTAPDPVLT